MSTLAVTLFILIGVLAKPYDATVYFKEDFSDSDWTSRWVYSKHTGKEYGKFELTPGKFYGDAEHDQGIKTSEDARFYAISSKFADTKFDNENKDLVLQFTVKHEQNIDCGGGYLKLFDCSLDQEQMHGDSEYKIMFGPDICGPATKKVHLIFNYKGNNLLINKDIRCKDDEYTHLYRLVVKPDNTYKVSIDGVEVEKGELEKDWDFLPPRKIKDPDAKKPSDWDDREKIDDPNDKKPDDWDVPEFIPDPDATKPDDWDDEMDGEWQPGQISNPAFKGEWKPSQIDNPAYKGPWVHPEIDNPEYVPDDKLYHQKEICAVGIDVWQVKSGTIFDNILITDDEKEADAAADIILKQTIEGEKKMKKELDEVERKKEEEEKASKEKDDSSSDTVKEGDEPSDDDDNVLDDSSSAKDEL
ncbi:Calreticulin, partial [Fragariocoptes setiger]